VNIEQLSQTSWNNIFIPADKKLYKEQKFNNKEQIMNSSKLEKHSSYQGTKKLNKMEHKNTIRTVSSW
jgi:hypothetical protein